MAGGIRNFLCYGLGGVSTMPPEYPQGISPTRGSCRRWSRGTSPRKSLVWDSDTFKGESDPRGEYCCGSTWGSGYYWCLLQLYYVISLHHPDLLLIDVILVPMLLPALHSDDLGGRYGPLKTQYLGAQGAGQECLELELD